MKKFVLIMLLKIKIASNSVFASRCPNKTKAILKIFIFAFALLIFTSNWAFAKETKFNDLVLESGDIQKIIIVGAKGAVKLIPSKMANSPRLIVHARKVIDEKRSTNSELWNYSAKREDKNMKIEVHGPDSSSSVDEMKQPSVDFYFEIEAPSTLPVDISWRIGSVSVQSWNAPLNISVIDGVLSVAQCTSSVRIQSQTGEIKISNQKGRVDIDAMKSKLFVSDSEGSLRIKNFSGENNIQNVSSSIHVQSKLGATHITKSQGSIELENGKGTFNILDFNGSIHGQNEDGAVTAKLLGDVDVALDSLTGSMSFKLPEKSAAYAKLQSDEGILSGLDGFKNAKLGNAKLLIGRFAGTEKGSIVLKSKSGNLRVH